MTSLADFPITRKWPAQHPDRLQLYSLPTPNGVKVSIALEELGLPYEPHLVTFDTNDQLTPEFKSLNPYGKIPAIIDPDGPGGKPLPAGTPAENIVQADNGWRRYRIPIADSARVQFGVPDLTLARHVRVWIEGVLATDVAPYGSNLQRPMLLIGGQGALDQHRMGSLQDLPHVDIMRPITKFASSVLTTERVADMVAMAFRECYAGAPGPSFLEIGRDVLDKSVDLKKAVLPKRQGYRFSTKSLGDPRDIEKLADILVKSKKPCVLLGTQVWTCRATDAARRFGAEVLVLHVLEAGEDPTAVKSQLDDLRERFAIDGVAARILLEQGEPAQAILAAAKNEKADLIVLSTHGRSGIDRMVTGSVTESVAREAKVPLLVVRGVGAARSKPKARSR